MKIKAVGALCAKVKQIVLLDDGGELWISDGTASYRLPDSLKAIGESAVTAIFDIPPEKAADYYIRRKDMAELWETEDTDPSGDAELSFDLDCRICYNGTDYLPMSTSDGKTYLIRTRYVKPLEDAEQIRFTLRHTNQGEGRPYIAAKDGMFLTAIIMPEDSGKEKGTWISGWTGEISTGLSRARSFEHEDL